MSSEISNKEYFTNEFLKNEQEIEDNLSADENEVNATNSSSNLNSNFSDDDASETDSSDELNENNANNDEEEEEEDLKPMMPIKPVNPQTPNSASILYQQNCLAAAQMMQLMSASFNTSNSIVSSNPETAQVNGQEPNTTGESEKENIPICKYCSKVFANFSNLNHHISAIHLNQSKWICSQCGKICSSKSNLKVHLRVHLRVKPYHCRWCSYSCMHHSSIRDHLAKVHPDKSHTPLQPGYLFNSHAVPEPEVFNSIGFNVNSFVSDSNLKRSNESVSRSASNDKTPDKRATKKTRLSSDQKSSNIQQVSQNSIRPTARSRSPTHQNINQMTNISQTHQANNNLPSKFNQTLSQQVQQTNNTHSPTSMSNLYNAYTMARMFHPFMYHPMQLHQYAAAAAASNPQQNLQQTSPSSFLGIMNQNMIHYNNQRTGILPSYGNPVSNFTESPGSLSNNLYSSAFTNLALNSHSTSSSSSTSSAASTSSEEHPTNSSNLSYSTSSRSSSMSPANKTNHQISPLSKNICISTSTEDKCEKNDSFLFSNSAFKAAKLARKTLTVDQMLNNKFNKETQTDSSCLTCPYCSNSCL